MSISCSKKPEWWLCSLCIVMSGPHTRNIVGTVRSYHFVVTFPYHGFGNSGCGPVGLKVSRAKRPNETGCQLTGLLAFAGPGFNVLTLGALEREQFAARALSLNAKQQHCRPAFGAGVSLDRIGVRCGWLIPGHRAHHIFIGSQSPGARQRETGDGLLYHLIFKYLAGIFALFQTVAQGDK